MNKLFRFSRREKPQKRGVALYTFNNAEYFGKCVFFQPPTLRASRRAEESPGEDLEEREKERGKRK